MKKKLLGILIAAMVLICGFAITSQARTGDVIGSAQHTDIVAYINHYAIPSYVVNGNTVIIAEDLQYYGFNVTWDNYSRKLYIEKNNGADIQEINLTKNHPIGSKCADVVETDIRVYANGRHITSYSVNNLTMIPIDDLAFMGELVWSSDERAIKLWIGWTGSRYGKQPVYSEMYSLDGRAITVQAHEISSNQKVGWYMYENMVIAKANNMIKSNGYESAILYVEDEITKYNNTYFTYNIYEQLESMYAKWRNKIKSPVVLVSSSVDRSSSTPRALFDIWNLSEKDIRSIEVEFTCYDSKGKKTTNYPYLYNGTVVSSGSVEIYAYSRSEIFSDLYSNTATTNVKNIKINNVTFADGTTWYK